MDPQELPFVYEKSLRIIPAPASVIAYPGAWMTEPALGIDYVKVLHGEQGIVFERPLEPTATVRGEYEVLGVDDKGPGKGAVISFEKRIVDAKTGTIICRVRSTYFLRGHGACGGLNKPPSLPPPPPALPTTPPI